VTVRDVLGHAKLETTNRYQHSKIDPAAIVAVNAAFGVAEDDAGRTTRAGRHLRMPRRNGSSVEPAA